MQIRTYDEILTTLCDTFDSFISPKRIYRDDSNTVYLILKSIAKGYEVDINAAANVVNNKFSPDKNDDFDLESLARLVGTDKMDGKSSGLIIYAFNDSDVEGILSAGEYYYQYDATTRFSFTLLSDVHVAASSSQMFVSFSVENGNYPVSSQSNIVIRRVDEGALDPDFVFSCENNADILGRTSESNYEFRSRILSDTDRQDLFSEMETALRSLPRILDARVMFNPTDDAVVVDGISIPPYHFLLAINGDVTNEVADTVARYGYFPSTQVSPTDVVVFSNPLFVGGAYPVYFTHFGFLDYDVRVTYEYDDRLTSEAVVEREIASILNKYKFPSSHKEFVTEGTYYDELKNITTPSFRVLDVALVVSGVDQSYINVPRTRYPRLNTIVFDGSIA